jgi:hypothetical protein
MRPEEPFAFPPGFFTRIGLPVNRTLLRKLLAEASGPDGTSDAYSRVGVFAAQR